MTTETVTAVIVVVGPVTVLAAFVTVTVEPVPEAEPGVAVAGLVIVVIGLETVV